MNKKGSKSGRPGPVSIGAVLKEILADRPIIKQINKDLSIWEAWDRAVGSDVAKHAQPKYFRSGILFVETNHPIWTTELQFRSHKIREKLNQSIGEDLVKEIHFRIGKN